MRDACAEEGLASVWTGKYVASAWGFRRTCLKHRGGEVAWVVAPSVHVPEFNKPPNPYPTGIPLSVDLYGDLLGEHGVSGERSLAQPAFTRRRLLPVVPSVDEHHLSRHKR